MNLQVIFCNHQMINLDVRERLAFSTPEQFARAYDFLRQRWPGSDFVLLSTCNRVEIYAAQEDPTSAPTHADLANFFSDFHHVPISEFFDELLECTGPEAVRHLFQVASSLDSMVLGEPQIVTQVKDAYRRAGEFDACGPLTHALFQAAIRVSARVRTETKLAEGRVSIASVAVGEFAKDIFDRFDDKVVLVIGAGEMAEETLRYLRDEGSVRIVVANRSLENARELAVRWQGEAVPLEHLDDWLGRADVIVSTTGASVPIVEAQRFKRCRAKTQDRPVFILDLGAPRDFAGDVADLPEVFLYDIDDLKKTCDENRRRRRKEVEAALRLIDEETERFMAEVYHRATGPIVTRLRETWHDVSRQELDRLFQKIPHLEEQDRRQVEKSVHRIVNKLLHPPLEALRDEAREGTPHGLIHAMKRLFHLSD